MKTFLETEKKIHTLLDGQSWDSLRFWSSGTFLEIGNLNYSLLSGFIEGLHELEAQMAKWLRGLNLNYKIATPIKM